MIDGMLAKKEVAIYPTGPLPHRIKVHISY